MILMSGLINIRRFTLPQNERAMQVPCPCYKNQSYEFELCLSGNVVHCAAPDFVYSPLLAARGYLKLHHFLRLYCSLSKSFFRYVAATLSSLAFTLKSRRPPTVMQSQFLLSVLLLSTKALATLHEQDNTPSGVLTPQFLKSLSCS